jgi:hypothetical protein
MNTKTENLPSLSLKGGSRPIHDLMLRLPALVALSDGGIDFAASKPDLLVNIAVDAGHTMRTMHKGIAAIGHLLALASPEIETQECPGDVVESVGWLLNELSDLAAIADYLATTCRRYTHDYLPPKKNR